MHRYALALALLPIATWAQDGRTGVDPDDARARAAIRAQVAESSLPSNRQTDSAPKVPGWSFDKYERVFDDPREDAEIARAGQAGARRLVGQSVDKAIGLLGFPSGEVVAAGRRGVTWTTQTPGCRVVMEIDRGRVVRSTEIVGNALACRAYSRKLASASAVESAPKKR